MRTKKTKFQDIILKTKDNEKELYEWKEQI